MGRLLKTQGAETFKLRWCYKDVFDKRSLKSAWKERKFILLTDSFDYRFPINDWVYVKSIQKYGVASEVPNDYSEGLFYGIAIEGTDWLKGPFYKVQEDDLEYDERVETIDDITNMMNENDFLWSLPKPLKTKGFRNLLAKLFIKLLALRVLHTKARKNASKIAEFLDFPAFSLAFSSVLWYYFSVKITLKRRAPCTTISLSRSPT